jgi:tetratricopeptide (TPR) repeat protein
VAVPDDSVVFIERLKWDRTPAYEAALIEDAPQNVRAFDVEEKFEPAPFNTGVAYAMESAVGFAMQDSFANMVQAEQPADVQTLELDRNPEMVLVVSPEPVIVTDVPEFMAEDSTSPAAVEYEEPVEIPMVELSEIERDVIEAEIRRLEQMVTSNPRNHFVWYRLGSQYRQLGLYDKAVGAFENAVSINSSNVAYVYQLGLACSAVGRHDDAVALFERVIAMDPNQSLAHASLGGYYRKNGNLELAQVYIERARNLLPRDESEYNRACVEAICGNTDLALELLEIALQIRQSYVNLARRDPDLDFIRSDSRFHALLTQYATQPVQ